MLCVLIYHEYIALLMCSVFNRIICEASIFNIEKTHVLTHQNWATNETKHLVSCDCPIGGSTASAGLHLFNPLVRISNV